jgi:streptogramin lyase
MSTRKSVYVIFALLVLSIGIFSLPQSATSKISTETTSQVTSMQGPPDPPTARVIREYLLPVIPLTTIAYLGPARTPFDVAYDSNGYAWVTDIARDTIYRLTPATVLNQSSTNALEWVLPNNAGKRTTLYIVADDSKKVVWFTNPTSHQISRLNWSTNRLDDWNLANLNVMPLDLVIQSSNVIWFTGLNDSRFFRLQADTGIVSSYSMNLPTGGPANVKPTRITFNGTYLFMTDFVFDTLYEVPLPPANAFVFPLTSPGFSWDVDVDISNNAWVTQPQSSLIDEQLAHSTAKALYTIDYVASGAAASNQTVKPSTLNVLIRITPVTPSAFSGPLNVIGDPLVVWSIPTGVTAVTYVPPPAKPWDVATSADGYAWFTEPLYNHVGVIQPDTNTTLLYLVPTAQSLPLSMDIQPGNQPNPYHVWFTEYRAGQIGELFNASSAIDLRLCPSLPPQYPPPPPGSIRWTTTEIWIDAPYNGIHTNDHDSPERGAINMVRASITNLGSIQAPSVTVYFYWYSNTSYSLDLNYIPLPPTPVSTSWTLIGAPVYIANWNPGVNYVISMSWTIGAEVPDNVTIGVQVVSVGDYNLYDKIGYANFTVTTPNAPPTFTVPGVAAGFIAGVAGMGLIIVVARGALLGKKSGKH